MREWLKALARAAALVGVLPALASYRIRASLMGRDRALEGSTQMLSLVPGLTGQYLRRAFLARTIGGCHKTAAVCFGTIFSQAGARIDERVYVGPGSYLGLVHIERDALLGSGVHVTSGRHTHGIADAGTPFREQPGLRTLVKIGAGAWIGSAAIIMADIGRNTVVGAGAVVTKPLPDFVVAAGVPARIIRQLERPATDGTRGSLA
jgi:acetyltransferase-like isoleucine patch superfamily enzyme